MEAERAELEQEKAKRELRRKFAQRKVGEGGFEINAERYEYLKYSQYCTIYFTTLFFFFFLFTRLQSLMNRWKELLVDREGDIVGMLQEAVSEKKDNAIAMRRSEAKIVKENIEMMVSGVYVVMHSLKEATVTNFGSTE